MSEQDSKFVSFFKRLNVFRLVIVNIFFLISIVFLIIFIAGSFGGLQSVSLSTNSPISSGDRTKLLINPTGVLFEDSWWSDTQTFNPDILPDSYYFDLTQAIKYAIDDPKIDTIYLELSSFVGGDYPQLKEIVSLLKKFKLDGRKIVAYADSFTQSSYYLASIADEIKIGNMGSLVLSGYNMQALFFGEFLKKYKIDVEVFRSGDFKSAVEPYLRDSFSQKAKDNLSLWVNEIWESYLKDLSNNRGLAKFDIKRYSNNISDYLVSVNGNPAKASVKAGLVDEVVQSSDSFGSESAYSTIYENSINYLSYIQGKSVVKSSNKISILTAEGSITSGYPKTRGSVGFSRFYEQVDKAFSDSSVKAVVLRINSPGGSAYASEQMRIAINEARKENPKPLVISMGGTAASGGYWLAMAGDKILADKGSITGSIGVFGMFPSFQRVLNESLGINIDGISTTEFGQISPMSAMNNEQKKFFQLSVENTYSQFITLVSESRLISPQIVNKNAGGRVFSGKFAKSVNLVDENGGFYDAVELAAKLAKLDDWEIDFNKRKKSMVDILSDQLLSSFPSNFIASKTTKIIDQTGLNAFLTIKDPSNCYAYSNYTFTFY